MCFASLVVGGVGVRLKREPLAVIITGGDQKGATGEARGLESHVPDSEEVGVIGTSVVTEISVVRFIMFVNFD
jgi:hypothetical protein